MAVSKPHVLVSRVPVPAGSDTEYKNTGKKPTSTWLDLSAARGQFFSVKLRVALICSILVELKLSQGSHGTWGFTEAYLWHSQGLFSQHVRKRIK